MPLSSSCFPRTTTKPKHTAASATRAPPTASGRVAATFALPVDKLDPHPLEVLALAFGLHYADPALVPRQERDVHRAIVRQGLIQLPLDGPPKLPRHAR